MTTLPLSISAGGGKAGGKLILSFNEGPTLSWIPLDKSDDPIDNLSISHIASVTQPRFTDKVPYIRLTCNFGGPKPAPINFECNHPVFPDLEARIMTAILQKIMTATTEDVPVTGLTNLELINVRRQWIEDGKTPAPRASNPFSEEGMEPGPRLSEPTAKVQREQAMWPWPEAELLQWTLYPQPHACKLKTTCFRCLDMWRSEEMQKDETYAYTDFLDDGQAARKIQEMIQAINSLRESLESIAKTYGSALYHAWVEASVQKREHLLAALSTQSFPQFEAFDRTLTAIERRTQQPVLWHAPYLTRPALQADPMILINMIHDRIAHHPSEFLAKDLLMARPAMNAGHIGLTFNRQFIGAHRANYGDVVPWDDFGAHSMAMLSYPEARVGLQAQKEVLSILVDIAEQLTASPQDGPTAWQRGCMSLADCIEDEETIHAASAHQLAINENDEPDEEQPAVEPRTSSIMAFPFVLQKALEVDVLLEVATSRFEAAEDALRLMQSDAAHLQDAVQELRKGTYYKSMAPPDMWACIAHDLWTPLFRRVQAWYMVKSRAELLVKVLKAETLSNRSEPEALSQNFHVALAALYTTINTFAMDTVTDQSLRTLLTARSLQENLVKKKMDLQPWVRELGGKFRDDYIWHLDDLREDAFTWALTEMLPEKKEISSRVYDQHHAMTTHADQHAKASLLLDHLTQNGYEESQQLYEHVSDISALTWLRSVMETNRPLPDPRIDWQSLGLRSATELLPESEFVISDEYSLLPEKQRQGLAQFKDTDPRRLRPVGGLLQELCENTPWPTAEVQDSRWLIATTVARQQLSKFWTAMRDVLKADLVQDNGDRPVHQIEASWEMQMASLFHSKEIADECRAQVKMVGDMKQRTAMEQMMKSIAEREHAKTHGNPGSGIEWRRKGEQNAGVRKGKKASKKRSKNPQTESKPKTRLTAENQLIMDHIAGFAEFFEEEEAELPADEMPPSSDPVLLNPRQFAVLTWLFPKDSRSDQVPGNTSWNSFRSMMAAAGFSSVNTDGSEWSFRGQDARKKRATIIIHAPHKSERNKIKKSNLENIGRRLKRRLYWTYDMFKQAK